MYDILQYVLFDYISMQLFFVWKLKLPNNETWSYPIVKWFIKRKYEMLETLQKNMVREKDVWRALH